MVARTRPMLRYTYTACLVYAVFWLTLALTACPAPAACTPLHTVTVLVRTDTEKFCGLDNFSTNGSELGLCPRFGLMVGTRRAGVMKITSATNGERESSQGSVGLTGWLQTASETFLYDARRGKSSVFRMGDIAALKRNELGLTLSIR
jgi:hypothetical protein